MTTRKPLLGPEPMTVLTDLFLAAASVYAAVQIGNAGPQPVHACFAVSFWLIALGTLTGATIHAVRHTSLNRFVPLLWRVTGIAVGGSVTAMLAGAFYHVLAPGVADALLWGVIGLTIIYAGYVWYDYRFKNVIFFYGFFMLVVLGLMGLDYVSTGSPGAKLIAIGILVSLAAAAIQRAGLRIAKHFNHNDLYHVIQLLGLYCFYRGALLL